MCRFNVCVVLGCFCAVALSSTMVLEEHLCVTVYQLHMVGMTIRRVCSVSWKWYCGDKHKYMNEIIKIFLSLL